jgi:hypothetical protein
MVIFNSYIKLPEGMSLEKNSNPTSEPLGWSCSAPRSDIFMIDGRIRMLFLGTVPEAMRSCTFLSTSLFSPSLGWVGAMTSLHLHSCLPLRLLRHMNFSSTCTYLWCYLYLNTPSKELLHLWQDLGAQKNYPENTIGPSGDSESMVVAPKVPPVTLESWSVLPKMWP